jgi:polyphosphate kinase
VSSLVDIADGDPPRLLNRELSWLDFNERVLALAENDDLPLLERLKFCAIFSSNMDEFFQVRVSALKDQVAAGLAQLSPDGRTPAQQLLEIGDRVEDLVRHQEVLFLDTLLPAIRDHGIAICSWDELDKDDQKHLDEVFDERVFPVLTPLGVDPAHPFPYISNLSLNLAVLVYDAQQDLKRFARVKVPPALPRFIGLPDGERFVPLEEVIAAHLAALFPGMTVIDHWMFRVTRNADLTVEEEEADDLLAALEMELRRRRFGRAVRLEMEAGAPADVVELLVTELDLSEDDISFHRAPLDLTGLWALHRLDRPDLKDEPWLPVTHARLTDAQDNHKSLFDVIRYRDVLVHHPYDSFVTSVEEFIRQAAADPNVLSIKLTLYRTSGDSAIAAELIRAAERGVQVAALVELKARFDEERNITWAKRLEEAGVHVVYGLVGLKTHSKCALVVRDEPEGLRRYAHVGTGNYNATTARLYEDLGLLTDDPQIGSDLSQLFNNLTGFSREDPYRRLLVAPRSLRPRFLDLIAREASYGQAGRITMKMNSLVDTEMIEALYSASQAGVRVDLIIRGICCLLPGVPGLSETIRVRSILGRYLEHSRVYYFANGDRSGKPLYYIGSADLMPRNLDGRVEVLVPVFRDEHQRRLQELLDVSLAEGTRAWELGSDARWQRVGGDHGIDSQAQLYELARQRARTRSIVTSL